MRVAIAGLFEEVNTFATETMGPVTITGNITTGFQQWTGQALLDENRGTETFVGGLIDALEASPEVEVVPAAFWSYLAGPIIEGNAYQQMKQDILEKLSAALPLDAVALHLHGAGIAEGVDDVEGDLTAAIRQLVGPNVKLVCTLDHHTNATDLFLQQIDLATTVYGYPHTDAHAAAYRAARLIPDMVKGTVKPCGHFEYLPFIMQMLSTLDGQPYVLIRQQVEAFAQRDGIYEFSFFYGFPLADIAFNTPAVNCWASSPELASSTAKEFAVWLWENRQQFVAAPITAASAIQQALSILAEQNRIQSNEVDRPVLFEESQIRLARADEELAQSFGFLPDLDPACPILIADKSDNPGGGAPGDATHLLWELIHNQVQQAAVCFIRDPETVKQALQAGVGSIIDVVLGGKYSKLGGEPVRGKAYVKTISDGRFTMVSPLGRGVKIDVGPAVGLTIEGVDVAVVCGLVQAYDHSHMRLVGFDPRDYRIIVVKSANHFRAWWSRYSHQFIDCDTPGLASNDLSTFTFQNKTRKLYPLDADAVYPEPAWQA
jgi:microcystin degradation protein MlrC